MAEIGFDQGSSGLRPLCKFYLPLVPGWCGRLSVRFMSLMVSDKHIPYVPAASPKEWQASCSCTKVRTNRLLQSPVKFIIGRCPTHPTHEFQTTALFSLPLATGSQAWLGNGFWDGGSEIADRTLYLPVQGTEAERRGCPRSHGGLKVRVLAIWSTTSFDLNAGPEQCR